MIDLNNLPVCFGGYLMQPKAAGQPKWDSTAPASLRYNDPYYGRPLPRFEGGGDLTPHLGEPVLVGEAGPELVVPTAPATVLPSGSFDAERARRLREQRQLQARTLPRPGWLDAKY